MNRTRKISLLGIVIATVASFGLLSTPAYAVACRSSLNIATYPWVRFTAYRYVGPFETRTTANCRDLNVKIDKHSCPVWIDAKYLQSSGGYDRWVDGAHDDFWMQPGQWYTPITNLKDNVPVVIHLKPSCSDPEAAVVLAA